MRLSKKDQRRLDFMWQRAASKMNKCCRLRRRPRGLIMYLHQLLVDLEELGADTGR